MNCNNQRGAALIVVLLLAATLSFVVLALISAMSVSTQRTAGASLRGELLWRAISVETLASATIEEALSFVKSGGPVLSRSHPLFSQQLDIPFADGAGAAIFADATDCFNLNSLAVEDQESLTANILELIDVLISVGLSNADATQFTATVRDWVDVDDVQEAGGAEDGFYTTLPAPYRTGGGPIASITELRAMKGVTAELYAAVTPYLCAVPSTASMMVNINTLHPDKAAVLAGLIGSALDYSTVRGLLVSRPPGGWSSNDQFWAQPALSENQGIDTNALKSRTSISSDYIRVRAGVTVNDVDMVVRLVFSTLQGNDRVMLTAREFGNGE